MKQIRQLVSRGALLACCLGLAVVTAFAQGGRGGGSGGGGGQGGPGGGSGGHEEMVANNLSYPAALTTGMVNANLIWGPPVGGGMLGVNYSFGCDVPDGEYPNTSCMSAEGAYLDAAACSTMCGGAPVSRIYWQKVSDNDWWAQTTPVATPQTATFADWGDNLEVVSWRETSVIRVETTPYATLTAPLQGLQMWHVSGRGPDEQWGVRTTNSSSPMPYVYASNYASIYTTTARLDITKLGAAASTCPTSAGAVSPVVPTTWSEGSWVGTNIAEIVDVPFTAELNVQGKYVHGYNFFLRRVAMPGGWSKGGWWRLTFYTTGAVAFAPDAVTTPPPAPTDVVILSETEETLYTPVVDAVTGLTYIDICIVDKRTGRVPPGQAKK